MGLGGLGAVRAGVAGGSAERLWDHDVSLQREAEGEDKEVRREGGGREGGVGLSATNIPICVGNRGEEGGLSATMYIDINFITAL